MRNSGTPSPLANSMPRYLVLASLTMVLGTALLACKSTAGDPQPPATADGVPAVEQVATLDTEYVGLSTGPLSAAQLADLPEDMLLRSAELSISRSELDAEIEGAVAAGADSEMLRDYPFFLLENMAVEALIKREAKQWADANDGEGAAPLEDYVQSIADGAQIDDEQAREYYDANTQMFGEQTYEQIAEQLKSYLLGQAQQAAVAAHINALSERHTIEVDTQFAAEVAETELANPVAEARRSGLPSLVDFGSHGCGPCDMMTPILEELETSLAGRCNVLFVPVREEPILAARYGIQTIPVQVFFDADGREIFRHVGFFSRDDIMLKLAEMGVPQ